MPELTLADVERLEAKLAEYRQHRAARPLDLFSDKYEQLHRRAIPALYRASPALLALAREALERRGGPRVVKRDLLPSKLEDDHA